VNRSIGTLAAALLAASALILAAIGYGSPFPRAAQREAGQTRYLARFDGLRDHLAGTPTAGYVDLRLASEGRPRGGRFFLAQYALAPTLLERGTRPEMVVGNFETPDARAAFLTRTRLVLVTDFGNGVVLLRNPYPGSSR
jgi:hypothetical protein